MLTIKEVKENELIDKDILDTIPDKCKCGSELEFTESLSQLVCTNDKCKYKLMDRIDNMLAEMGLKGWGESAYDELITKFKFSIPFQLMLVKQLEDNNIDVDIVDFNKKVKEIEEIKNTEIELWKIVKFASIEYISSIAYELFSSYDNMEEAYDDIEKGQITFITEKIGLRTNEPSVISLLLYDELIKYKEELLFAETQFNIKKHKNNPIRLAIAGNIYGFINKTSFIDYLNRRYIDKASFVLDSSITANTKILVCEGLSNSTKYRTAKRINEKFISDSIAKGEFELSDIKKFNTYTDLLAIGEKVAICKGDELIKRLDRIYKSI